MLGSRKDFATPFRRSERRHEIAHGAIAKAAHVGRKPTRDGVEIGRPVVDHAAHQPQASTTDPARRGIVRLARRLPANRPTVFVDVAVRIDRANMNPAIADHVCLQDWLSRELDVAKVQQPQHGVVNRGDPTMSCPDGLGSPCTFSLIRAASG